MKFYLLLIIGIIINLFIWINSLMPGSVSGAQSSFIAQIGYDVFVFFIPNLSFETFHLVIRKLAHFTLFFILGLVWFKVYGFKFNLRATTLLTITHGLTSALIDEGIQYFVEARASSIVDVLIDFSGVLTAIVLSLVVYKIIVKGKNKHDI